MNENKFVCNLIIYRCLFRIYIYFCLFSSIDITSDNEVMSKKRKKSKISEGSKEDTSHLWSVGWL